MLVSDRIIDMFGMTNKKYLGSLLALLTLPLGVEGNFLIQPAIGGEVWFDRSIPGYIAQSAAESEITIFVDPQQGDDSQSGNSQSTSLKTITKALEIADSGTTIQLASGTYSEATGETFPLVIKQNVIIKGSPASRGHNIVIEGNGYFISRSGAGQNVAIAAAKDARGVMGVTVVNPHNRGHGLWLESASPTVIGNSFINNGNTGLSVNGSSSPLIKDNYFYNNGGNGLLVHGTSQPEIENNIFEKTGFGISAVKNAALVISDNQFKGNRIGIILEGESQAILRNNTIENSLESGLTAISQSRADLGTNEQPGNNNFNSNSQLDIQNATSNEIIAVGTNIDGNTAGQVNFDRGEGLAFAANSNSNDSRSSSALLSVNKTPKNNLIDRDTPLLDSARLRDKPIGSSSSLPETSPDNQELVFNAPTASQPVPFPPETQSGETLPSPPEVVFNSDLTAPSPLNSTYNRKIGSLSDVLGSASTPTIRYKVLVETKNDRQQREVRSLYPEAFPTVYQGKSVLQVGAFSNWGKAQQARRSLQDLGLNSHILE